MFNLRPVGWALAQHLNRFVGPRPHLHVCILMLSICMFTGCTPLPRPLITPPKETRSGLPILSNQTDFRFVAWWKKMHDPTLNRLITLALAQNNQIKTTEANVLSAQSKLAQAHLAWLPTLDASATGFVGGGWDTHFTPKGPLALSPVFTDQNNMHFRGYYSGFVPRYTVNIMGNLKRTQFAEAALHSQEAAYQSAKLTVISQVAGAYFMLLGHQQQLQDQENIIHDAERMRRLTYLRYKDGAGDLAKVTELDQQITDYRASLPTIENNIAQVENALQVLINQNPAPLLHHGNLKKLSVQHLIPSHLPAGVLKNRPDVVMADENLKMADANVGIAYAHFFPSINLTGLVGGASASLSHLLSISTGLWVAQAAASVPILNGVTYEQIQEAKAGYLAAYYTYLQTVRSAFAEVDNVLTQQQKINQFYTERRHALSNARRLFRFAEARYRSGATDSRQVAEARINVDKARLNLTLAKMQQLDCIVQVYQALAGGYCAN